MWPHCIADVNEFLTYAFEILFYTYWAIIGEGIAHRTTWLCLEMEKLEYSTHGLHVGSCRLVIPRKCLDNVDGGLAFFTVEVGVCWELTDFFLLFWEKLYWSKLFSILDRF